MTKSKICLYSFLSIAFELIAIICDVAQGIQYVDKFPGALSMISAGDGFTCAIDSEFKLHCWGDQTLPSYLDTSNFYSVSCTVGCCGLRKNEDKPIVCWGYDGLESPSQSLIDQGINDTLWVQVATSAKYGCGIFYQTSEDSSNIVCWGEVPGGDGTPNAIKRRQGENKWVQVVLSLDAYCGISGSGGVSCFGSSGNITSLNTLQQKDLKIAASNTVGMLQVACTIDSQSQASCFGMENSTAAEGVMPNSTMLMEDNIDGGSYFCGINKLKNIECWPPMVVDTKQLPDLDWTSVGVGTRHYCGIDSEREMHCWPPEDPGSLVPGGVESWGFTSSDLSKLLGTEISMGVSAGNSSQVPVGAIAGAIAGVVAAVLLAIGILFYYRKRKFISGKQAAHDIPEMQTGSTHISTMFPFEGKSSSDIFPTSNVSEVLHQKKYSKLNGIDSQNSSSLGKGSSLSKTGQSDSLSLSKRGSNASAFSDMIREDSNWNIKHTDIEICKDSDGKDIVLGSGGYGMVLRGLRHGVQDIAIKVSRVEKTSVYESILSEAEMMKEMQDKNVVQFYGICIDDNTLMVVMELMEGGDLEKALLQKNSRGHFSWKRYGKKIALDIIKGLIYIHSKNIIHRDIKLKNVLLDGSLTVAKIADVGVARILENEEGLTFVGTHFYLAPEVRTGIYGLPVDIYSFGVLLRALITGEIPKRGGPIRSPTVPDECPESIANLVERCMDDDPGKRPTAMEIFTTVKKS